MGYRDYLEKIKSVSKFLLTMIVDENNNRLLRNYPCAGVAAK